MKKQLKKLREEKGFTLIEMLIVIMIVSLLLLLVMTNVGGVQDTVKTTTNAGIVQTVDSQKVIYEMKEGKKPTLEELREGGYINQEQLSAYEKVGSKKPTIPVEP